MFNKKKKTYMDKINFDVFDEDGGDYDIFDAKADDESESLESEDEEVEDEFYKEIMAKAQAKKEAEAEARAKARAEEKTVSVADDKIEEKAATTEDHAEDYSEEDYAEEDYSEDEEESTLDYFYRISEESEVDSDIEDDGKGKGRLGLFLLFFLFICMVGTVAYLYYKTDVFDKLLGKMGVGDTSTSTETGTGDVDEAALDESFKTIYSYETNAHIDINALMADYYDALINGDKDKLKDIVTEPDAFGDMVLYETKSQVISEYSNITCYTIPGLKDNEILVFTTSNLNITGVESKPMDIQRFYVVDTGEGYKINNGVLSQETIEYINLQTGSPDVQALYRSVQDNINQCLAEDSTFAEFMNTINTNTDADSNQ